MPWPADVHRDDVGEFQHGAGLRQPHPIELGRIVAGEIEGAVGAPRAAGVAHVLELVEQHLGEASTTRPAGSRASASPSRVFALWPYGVLLGPSGTIVIGEGHPPVAVVPVDPGERAPLDAEAVRSPHAPSSRRRKSPASWSSANPDSWNARHRSCRPSPSRCRGAGSARSCRPAISSRACRSSCRICR